MLNPNIHNKEINELLKEVDLKISDLKNNKNESEYIFRINLMNNKLGINYNNFESVKTTLKTLGILKLHILPPKKDIFAFYLYSINTNLLNEIKYHYNFDLQLYMKDQEDKGNKTNLVNVSGDIIGSQVGHESDFRDSEFHQIEKTYPNTPAATTQKKSNIFQKIWTFLNHQVVGGLIVAGVIALITWWLSKS